MFSTIAKSGAQVAMAALVGVTGLGLSATHHSDVAAGNSTEINAPRAKLPSVSANAESSAASDATGDVTAKMKPHATRWTAKTNAAVSGAGSAVVDSKPDEPNPPSEPPNPPSNPPSDKHDGVNLSLDGSANLDAGGDLSIGPGGVQAGSHHSSGLKVSLGF
jgi:hypothetical protein